MILRVDLIFITTTNPTVLQPRPFSGHASRCSVRIASEGAMRSCCSVMDFTPEGKGFEPQNVTASKEITWNYVKLHPGRLTAGSPTKWSSKPPWLCSMLIFRGVNMIKCMYLPEAFRLCFLPLKKIRGNLLGCTCRQCFVGFPKPSCGNGWGLPYDPGPMCSLSLWNPPVTSVKKNASRRRSCCRRLTS